MGVLLPLKRPSLGRSMLLKKPVLLPLFASKLARAKLEFFRVCLSEIKRTATHLSCVVK